MEHLFTIRRELSTNEDGSTQITGKHQLLDETGQLIGTYDTKAEARRQATDIQEQYELNEAQAE